MHTGTRATKQPKNRPITLLYLLDAAKLGAHRDVVVTLFREARHLDALPKQENVRRAAKVEHAGS